MAARTLLTICGLLAGAGVAAGQPPNDECTGALFLDIGRAYCSGVGEFSNVGATVSALAPPRCFPDEDARDTWVSFRAAATSVSIRLIGALPRDGGGTLTSPQLTLYTGACGDLAEVRCISDAFDANVVQVIADGLLPGELYYLRLGARAGGTGTFRLCIDQSDFAPEPQSDCADGVLLCSKDPFTVRQLAGSGDDGNEVAGTCVEREFASVWYKWTCDEPGDLAFVLTPSSPVDDLDFVVYELPDGVDACATKRVLRCEAAGENVGAPLSDWERCSGATGLRAGEPDVSEDPGCRPGNNNFVAAIEMVAGRSYALVVNNFSESGNGFSIEWSGAGTFVGPRPSFAVAPGVGGRCDLTAFRFLDATRVNPGAAVDYEWFFGSFAAPAQHTGRTPPAVTYGSFGEKVVTLRVRSSDGCAVTATRSIFVEECCRADDPLLARAPAVTDPACAGTPTGGFAVAIESGVGDYRYSVDGGPYLPDSARSGLFAGAYDVFVENVKGCRDTVQAVLTDPPPLELAIGDDLELAFGDSARVRAAVNVDGALDYAWAGLDSVRCLDEVCDEVVVYGLRSGELTARVASAGGCTAVDRVSLEVRRERPLYAPTAFSPDGDDRNDRWMLFGPPVVTRVDYLRIFDRWGNMVYHAEDLAPNDVARGWDGRFLGEPLDPAVFTWIAAVTYVDGTTVEATGDLTLMR